jgi:hypothetical protein
MSDSMLALQLTLAFFALLAAWVPFLDFLQRQWRVRRPRRDNSQAFALKQTNQPSR